MSSPTPTPWAVTCPEHGRVFMTEAEYRRELGRPDQGWVCPVTVTEGEMPGPCGSSADFDDENYEASEIL